MTAWVDAHCHLQLEIGEARFSPDDADAQVERARARGRRVDGLRGHRSRDFASGARARVAIRRRVRDGRACIRTTRRNSTPSGTRSPRWPTPNAASRSVRPASISTTSTRRATSRRSRSGATSSWPKRSNRPLMIHSRNAWDDTFRVLDDEGLPARTIFHCFTGGPDEARAALDRDCYLSFSGIVSFKTADDVRAAAALAPADRVLVETDSPYLAPVPHRGKPNEPAFVPIVGAALAAARGVERRRDRRADARERGAGVRRRAVTPSEIQALLDAARHCDRARRSARTFSPTPTWPSTSCASPVCSPAITWWRSGRDWDR